MVLNDHILKNDGYTRASRRNPQILVVARGWVCWAWQVGSWHQLAAFSAAAMPKRVMSSAMGQEDLCSGRRFGREIVLEDVLEKLLYKLVRVIVKWQRLCLVGIFDGKEGCWFLTEIGFSCSWSHLTARVLVRFGPFLQNLSPGRGGEDCIYWKESF